jgi:hypothetical protein
MTHDGQNGHDRGSDDRHHNEGWHGRGIHHHEPASVAVDQLDLTTYQHSDTTAAGHFHDQWLMQVTGAELSGTPVTVPGLNTAYGLYLSIDLTGHQTFGADGKAINGGNVFETLDVKLMLDPGHNNGAASSPLDGHVGFANGTADDIELAHGSIVSGHFEASNGAGHADFVESISLTRPGMAFLSGSLASATTLEEVLTTPFSLRASHTNPDGSLVSVANGGSAIAGFVPTQPIDLPGMNSDGSIPALLRAEFLATHLEMCGGFGRGCPSGSFADGHSSGGSAWSGASVCTPTEAQAACWLNG